MSSIGKIINGKYEKFADKGGGIGEQDVQNATITFEEAAQRENINSGDKLSTIAGKIRKWFSDLSNGAASTLLGNNLQEGKVLVSDGAGKISASGITSDTLEYLDGLTGNVQERLDDVDSSLAEMNQFDDYKVVTNAGLPDVLDVSLSSPHAEKNKKMTIYQSESNPDSLFLNLPQQIANKTVIAYRDVKYRSKTHVLVTLTEAYPIAGRTWVNFYNTGSWTGWTCNPTKDILLLNTTKYGLSFRIWGNPNEIHYRTSGSTTGEIPTNGAHVPIGILPVGYRPAINQFAYFIMGGYRCQIRFQTDGEVAIGYSAILSTGSSENIPAGVGCYTCGTIGLQSGE